MSEVWHIVADPSGHHRALSASCVAEHPLRGDERIVGDAPDYGEACREAARLNELAEVMES